tara:strand:- start:86 stop:289 length:204 start_codon:yes stop_codon:yes gene_type:complete
MSNLDTLDKVGLMLGTTAVGKAYSTWAVSGTPWTRYGDLNVDKQNTVFKWTVIGALSGAFLINGLSN